MPGEVDYGSVAYSVKATPDTLCQEAAARIQTLEQQVATLTAERDALREALERLQKAAEPVMKAEIDSGSIREIFIELANASIDARTALRTDAPGR
jgi:phage shock protein A